LSVTEGIACELLEPVVPHDCRLGVITCGDGNLVVAVKGDKAKLKSMKIGVWFCSSFPLADTLASMLRYVSLRHFCAIVFGAPRFTHLQAPPLSLPTMQRRHQLAKTSPQGRRTSSKADFGWDTSRSTF